ncbi:spore coat protein Z [Natronobacillus azotifigens]|uniref:CotY/CotZ family spore coat protein n=1 Tax=Natronobacillus azotifigens TaxID=472978 RepID=A0A9J6REL7_9BACI|nr:CotY/CotZ family spore coat protein [Natronobacillus azotifigens]MCZ0703901.1 CotY/CotZ family spore coat protein [Natronobacillus azotifigens]
MSCGKKFDTGNCVADILREIADAQTDLESVCTSGCEQSIADLLGEAGPVSNLDTVPVILYCKDCKPFKGFGAPVNDICNVFGSFYFRVQSVDESNCAVLELLRDPLDQKRDPRSPVDQLTKQLVATDVCITVDLDCFCHITCLPAIQAL